MSRYLILEAYSLLYNLAIPLLTMTCHAELPQELWVLTLQNLRHWKSKEDLVYLWTTVRLVNKSFKAATEETFRTEHLPKTKLHYHHGLCDGVYQNPITRPDIRIASFSFNHIDSKDTSRAVFFCSEGTSWDSSAAEQVFNTAQQRCGRAKAHKSTQWSFQTVKNVFVSQIRASLSNCAVPDLIIDSATGEISIDVGWLLIGVHLLTNFRAQRLWSPTLNVKMEIIA